MGMAWRDGQKPPFMTLPGQLILGALCCLPRYNPPRAPCQPLRACDGSHQEVRGAASTSTESVSKTVFPNGPFRVYFSEQLPPMDSGTLALGYSQGSHVF